MEHYKVSVTNEAKADMRGAARYIAVELREADTAYSFLDRLDVEITSLEELPERYSLVGDAYLASLGIRMTMVGQYLIFYSVDRTSYTVTILRMLHGRRDWINILTKQHTDGKPSST